MFSMNSKDLDLILANSFTIDFIEITLTPKRPHLPIYKGPGSVSQDDKGNLHLKLYYPLSLDANFVRHYGENLASIPGKLIREECYFRFEAMDMSGNIWTSEIRPLNNFSIPAAGTIISGNLRNIERVKERDKKMRRNSESVRMIIPGKYKLPCNEIQNNPNGGRTRNICLMTVNGIKVKIRNEENYISLQASSNNESLPENFELRLLEALSVMLGNLVFPICQERISLESERTVIWRKQDSSNDPRFIPIKHPYDLEIDSLRNFIESYLRKFSKPNQPFFTYWCRIHAAWQSAYTENTALIVCASIEGIIKDYYHDYMESDIGNLNQSGMHNTRFVDPKKILRKMSKNNWFTSKMVDEWISMRNMSAHGERYFFDGSVEEMQQNFDKLHSCIHIFNILLFQLIGFRGKYRNYSKEGWPVDDFPGENASDSGEVGGEG